MRRRLTVLVGMLFFCMVLGTATVATATAFPFAVGSGVNEAGQKFSFSAHEGPNGPTGYAKIDFPPGSEGYPNGFEIQGPITCFEADGTNEVRFGFEIAKGSGDIPTGSRSFTFWVYDGGKGPYQDYMGTGFNPEVPSECPFQFGATPILKGDIKVRTTQ